MKLDKSQAVYVIYNPILNITKIGISENINRRKQILECECGCRLSISYNTNHITGAIYFEELIHDRLKDKRGIGEWFNISPEEAIEVVKDIIKDAKTDIILSSYKEGKSISQIAEDNNVSRQAIIWRLRHNGLYNDKRTIIIPKEKAIDIPVQNKPIEELNDIYIGDNKPIGVIKGLKRIEPNINYNGEWYQGSIYYNSKFHYIYSKDINKIKEYIISFKNSHK